MKIIIIEDEAAAYKNIKNLLLQIDPHIEILDHFDTVVDSVTWLHSKILKEFPTSSSWISNWRTETLSIFSNASS